MNVEKWFIINLEYIRKSQSCTTQYNVPCMASNNLFEMNELYKLVQNTNMMRIGSTFYDIFFKILPAPFFLPRNVTDNVSYF